MASFRGLHVSGRRYSLLIELPLREGLIFRISILSTDGEVLDVVQKRFTPEQFRRFSPYFNTVLERLGEFFPS